MFAYLPDPFCLSGAFLQRIESYEGDHFFLSSEASNFAQRVHECQSVDHSDARMRHQQSGPLVLCCQLLESRLKSFHLCGDLVKEHET